MELASAKYAQCQLSAQSKDTKTPDPVKLAAALGKCSQRLSDCAATESSSAFDAYLTQASDGSSDAHQMHVPGVP